MMPGLSGEGLLAELRARPELDAVPVVLLTGRTDHALRARMLREGAQDYLQKPIIAEELRARVKNLVMLKRARDILQRDLGEPHARSSRRSRGRCRSAGASSRPRSSRRAWRATTPTARAR